MNFIKQIQTELEKLLKPLPHLPKNAQKWLSDNFWMLTLIGVVLMGLSVLSLVGGIIAAYSIANTYMGYFYVAAYKPSAWWLIQSLISVVAIAVSMIIAVTAIKPLKAFQKKGWDLMFLATVIGAVVSLMGSILSLDFSMIIGGIVSCALSLAIGGYLLFEVKPNFIK